MDLKSLGNTIRIARTQKGLSQYNMADELQISDVAYSKIERGLTNVSISRLNQIAHCLQIPLVQLIDNSYEQPLLEERKTQIESLEIRIRNLEVKVERILQAMK